MTNKKKYPRTNYKNGRDKIQPNTHESTYMSCSTISMTNFIHINKDVLDINICYHILSIAETIYKLTACTNPTPI